VNLCLKQKVKHIGAYTLIELLAVIFVVGAIVYANELGKSYGGNARIIIPIVGFVAACVVVVLTYYLLGTYEERYRRNLREKYRYIYRVIAAPDEEGKIKKHPSAVILIGDYGWEAPPLANDGLIYLQGLTAKWGVVWYAGFRPDQIEKIGLKPQSQYDWNYTWSYNTPPCLYPIVERETQDLGWPI
jgi:hypothetical protein